jgi:hypothetical protein
MLLLLAMPVMATVALAHRLLLAFAPSNVLIRRVRASRPTFRSAAVQAVAAVVLVRTAHTLSLAIRTGAPDWLNLLVLVLLWDAVKCSLLAVHTTARRLSVF